MITNVQSSKITDWTTNKNARVLNNAANIRTKQKLPPFNLIQ